MKIDITQKKDNPSLERKEIAFIVREAKATPSRKELREKIAAQVNVDEKKMVVDVLATSYGSTEITGLVRVYNDQKTLKRTELPYIITRNFGKEEAKPAEAKPP